MKFKENLVYLSCYYPSGGGFWFTITIEGKQLENDEVEEFLQFVGLHELDILPLFFPDYKEGREVTTVSYLKELGRIEPSAQ